MLKDFLATFGKRFLSNKKNKKIKKNKKNKNGHCYFEKLMPLILHVVGNRRKTYFSQYLETDSNAYMNF